jgi:hypothetical protein
VLLGQNARKKRKVAEPDKVVFLPLPFEGGKNYLDLITIKSHFWIVHFTLLACTNTTECTNDY